ncbi:MAG: hypothetical protein OEM02_01315 [Desulfobulbaceae bacterium]|nr:hypothetical protein [Desulfobulbaceae bacterium]
MNITKGKSLIILPLRFLVYFCLSFAIIFLSGSLKTTKVIDSNGEFLFFVRHDKPIKELSVQHYEEFCGSTAVQIGPEYAIDLRLLKGNSLFPYSNWKEIQERIFKGKQDWLCFVENNVVYAVRVKEETSSPVADSWFKVGLEELGAVGMAEKYPVIGPAQLKQHPEIEEILLEIDQRPDHDCIRLRYEPINISLQEWEGFIGSALGIYKSETNFIFGGHLYTAIVKTDYQHREEEIPGLQNQYIITGIFLLVIGFLVMTKLYRSVVGVKLMPNKVVCILDIIMIIILAILGFMGMDYFLAGKYGTISIMGEEGILGVFCYIPLLLIMPVVVSWQSARGVLVTEQGVLDSDLFLQSFMAWDELSRMELMDDVEFSGRRNSFKVLFLYSVDENAIIISGNIRVKAKVEIIALILKYVPENMKDEMQKYLNLL